MRLRTLLKTLVTVAAMLLVTQACKPLAYAGELEFGRTVQTGAAHTVAYIAGLEHKLGPVSLDASYYYGETNGVTTMAHGYLSMISDHELSSRCSVAGGNKAGFNNIRGIDEENFFGAGPKCYIIKDVLSFSLWYLNQHTEYADGPSETTHRLSFRPKLSVKDGDSEVRAVFYYQPSLDDPDDYITILEASYLVAISGDLAFKISYEDEYRSVAEGVRRETLEYISLTVRF